MRWINGVWPEVALLGRTLGVPCILCEGMCLLCYLTLNLVYSHNTVNMESVQYSIHYVRGGGGGDKCVTILCGGGSVRVWTKCVVAMVRVWIQCAVVTAAAVSVCTAGV